MRKLTRHTFIAITVSFGLLAACRQGTSDGDGSNGGLNQEPVNTEYDTPVKLKDYVTGTWVLDSTGRSTEQATGEAAGGQRIVFNREGRYMMYASNQQVDSGAYRVNEQHKILYLEREAGEEIDEWNVFLEEENQMTLTLRTGSAHGEAYRITYRRQ